MIHMPKSHKMKSNNIRYDNEESNVSIWNSSRGDKDVSAGEGVSEE